MGTGGRGELGSGELSGRAVGRGIGTYTRLVGVFRGGGESGEGKTRFEGEGYVGAHQAEGQGIERGKDHRILEPRDDGRPLASRARPRLGCGDLCALLARNLEDLLETERHGQGRSLVGDRRQRAKREQCVQREDPSREAREHRAYPVQEACPACSPQSSSDAG